MPQKRDAFTLVEMTIVVLIIGILASIAIPRYLKTVEASRARSAIGITHLIGIAHRMYEIDHPAVYKDGAMNNGHELVTKNYMAPQDWGNSTYDFFACNPVTGAGGGYCAVDYVAVCMRKTSGSPPAGSAGWGYKFKTDGSCEEEDGTGDWPAPDCPKI